MAEQIYLWVDQPGGLSNEFLSSDLCLLSLKLHRPFKAVELPYYT